MSDERRGIRTPARARARRWLAASGGGFAIEFALVAPILIVVLYAIFEIGRLSFTRTMLQYAVEEAGRVAAVASAPTNQQITAAARNRIVFLDPNDITVTVTVAVDSASALNFVTVQASYPFKTLLPLIPIGPVTLTSKSRVPQIR